MANSRSARKRIRANERKQIRNRAVRSSVRTYVTKARRALLQPAEGVSAEEALLAAVKALDRAAEKGILHRNNANRRKSRLTAMAYKVMRASEGEATEATRTRSAAAGATKPATRKGTGAKKAAAKPGAKAAAKPATKARTAKK